MNKQTVMPVNQPRNFIDHLRQCAQSRSEAIALVVVHERDGVCVERSITYGQLDERIRALASQLQQKFEPNARVLVLLENDDQYVVAFFACLYAGLIAVPAFPPESTREQHLERLRVIAQDAQASCFLTNGKIAESAALTALALSEVEVVLVETVDLTGADAWRLHSPADDDIAFLQYTSGSTSTPKGVMVSHGNLMANEWAIEQALSITENDVFVSWLPLFHDMGLIGGLLQPLHRGIMLVLMSPQFFLERPVRWLEAISRHRGTISGGPDFAYRLCVERINASRIAELDLSTWRVAFSGAEPVRHETLQRFTTHCAEAAFSPKALCPCYGLAEATLIVSAAQPEMGLEITALPETDIVCSERVLDPQCREMVACGTVVDKHTVSIRHLQSHTGHHEPCVGEIWVSGPSVAQGYWNNSDATGETFVEWNSRRWLRTGDLGFFHNGQLCIAGRIKDLIIVRGQNLYPQDIERFIETEIDAVRKGRVAAFAVRGDEGEGIGVAVEVSRRLQKRESAECLAARLTDVVSQACGEPPSVVLLLNPGALPKTSSGKLQRHACRQGWQDGTLDAYALFEQNQPINQRPEKSSAQRGRVLQDEVARQLVALWRDILPSAHGNYTRDHHFFGCGGNSLRALALAARIHRTWGIPFPPSRVFERPLLGEMADSIREQTASETTAVQANVIPVLSKQDSVKPLPLSHGQSRQWLSWQLDPKSSADHSGVILKISGELCAKTLRKALEIMIQRHESLRTVFYLGADNMPQQRILPQQSVAFSDFDWCDLPVIEQAQRSRETDRQLISEPFDLVQGPLWRVASQRFGQNRCQLTLVMHHIVSDAVSLGILVNELGHWYSSALLERDLRPPLVPKHRYVDYAVWQRNWVSSAEGTQQLHWWCETLGDQHPVLSLPVDCPKQPCAHHPVAQHAVSVPRRVAAQLRATAETGKGVTPFALFLCAYQVMLSGWGDQEEVRVGVPVANRSRPELASVIGFFVNTIVLSVRIDGRMSLGQVLEQSLKAAIAAQDRCELPFERLVEALHPVRKFGQNPLVQVTINHIVDAIDKTGWGEALTLQSCQVLRDQVRFELTLDIHESQDGDFTLSFVYAQDVFKPTTIAVLTQRYLHILECLVNEPERAVADTQFLLPEEQAQLMRWCSCTPPLHDPRRQMQLAHQLIEQRVRAHPDAPALIEGGVCLSYAQLDQRANQLACRLQDQGIGPESRVGVAVERGISMVVGFLATLKAGAAYVPLDPAYPSKRLAYMAQDSGMQLLLTQRTVHSRLSWAATLPVMLIDDVTNLEGPVCTPVPVGHPDNLAYVIYTSGSTGQPKGVEVTHGPLVSHLQAICTVYGVDASHREIFFSSLSFDAAVEQWMAPLCGGGVLLLCDHEQLDIDRFMALITTHRATALHLPPAYLRMLFRKSGANSLPIRTCVVGGEALPWTDCEEAKRLFGDVRLINAYGPTETLITPAAWVCSGNIERLNTAYAPIGAPVAHRRLYVLDRHLNLCAPGVAGELYVGGYEIARGYTGQTGQTASRFLADPFGESGSRMYRTGDRVCWLDNGQLAFLGRVDRQTKIRGFRIELGEIESRLLALPGVREGAVVVSADTSGERIVAYACGASGTVLDGATMRARLRESLPDYMVPSAVVILDELPLTPNGKVDRQSLPTPVWQGGASRTAPLHGFARRLHDLWCEVLNVSDVGLDDNFFDRGGHSILLVQLQSLLKERLSVQVAVIDLFRYPTLNALLEHLRLSSSRRESLPGAERVRDRAMRQRQQLLAPL